MAAAAWAPPPQLAREPGCVFWKRRSGQQPCDAPERPAPPFLPPGLGRRRGGGAAQPGWGGGGARARGAGVTRGRARRGGREGGPDGWRAEAPGRGAPPRTPSPTAAPRLAGQVGPAGRRPAPGNNECLSGRPRVTGRGGAEAAREAGAAGEGRRAGCVFARVTRPTPPAGCLHPSGWGPAQPRAAAAAPLSPP